MSKRRSGAECIAYHLGWNISDVSEGRYQAGRTGGIAVYVIGNDYMCCPAEGKNPPKGWNWVLRSNDGTTYGRNVWEAKA